MNTSETVAQFDTLYLGDSLLEILEVCTGPATCRLRFNAGKVLPPGGKDIFNPKERFAPAVLTITGVRSLTFEGPAYQLNSTVVDFGAEALPGGEYIEFGLDLTGGRDADAFYVKLRIIGKGFTFGPE